MSEYIKKQDAVYALRHDQNLVFALGYHNAIDAVLELPSADVVEIPKSGIGDLSDGYHTFNELYHQRAVLFATIVKAYKNKAWKSWRHEDGEPCFGGGWFVVGIDTPLGSYTYHYSKEYWDMFDCVELDKAKHWDGHTDKDVERLLTLKECEKDG